MEEKGSQYPHHESGVGPFFQENKRNFNYEISAGKGTKFPPSWEIFAQQPGLLASISDFPEDYVTQLDAYQ